MIVPYSASANGPIASQYGYEIENQNTGEIFQCSDFDVLCRNIRCSMIISPEDWMDAARAVMRRRNKTLRCLVHDGLDNCVLHGITFRKILVKE